jgi:hypothetical protein
MESEKLIKTIQEFEAKLFLESKLDEETFGEGSPLHRQSRSAWRAVHDLMLLVGIESDITLPDAQKATDVIYRKYNIEKLK